MTPNQFPIPNSPSFLVIGYGNSLRGDDGIGQQVAAEWEQWNLPQVQVKSLHQLTPELAEDLAKVDCAIFVDACIAEYSETVKVEMIKPDANSTVTFGHTSNPRSLLAMTLALYSHYPQSWLISVPGINFELCDRLSPVAEAGVKAALEQIEQLIKGGTYASITF